MVPHKPIREYSNSELHLLIWRGDFRPEGVTFIKEEGYYEINVGDYTVRSGLHNVRKYLALYDKYLKQEIDIINKEFYGDS